MAPFTILEPHYTFAGEQVGIGATEAGGFESAMEIHYQVMFGGLTHDSLVEIHHLLVIAIHEVHFNARYTPLFVQREGSVHVLVHGLPPHPEQHLDAAL